MPVAPGDLIGIMAHGDDGDGFQQHQLGGLENAKRIRRTVALVATACAGAMIAQVLPAVDTVVAVTPIYGETVVAILPQCQRPK
jgi:hypothetical protein